MVHLGLKNQINTWIVTYSLDLTLAQPSPSCSKNLCYLRKKKYMQSPRHICQDQQYRNENEWDQPEELCLLKLFLFSKSVESRTQSCTKSRLTGYDLFLLFIPAQSFIVTFPLFVFLHLQNTDRLNITKINVFCKTEWPLFTLAGMGAWAFQLDEVLVFIYTDSNAWEDNTFRYFRLHLTVLSQTLPLYLEHFRLLKL